MQHSERKQGTTDNILDNSLRIDLCIKAAQQYITKLQVGEDSQAENFLQELNQLNSNQLNGQASNKDLYTKVGMLTRELHDSMSSFMNDTRIHMMTNEDMPDARQRLQHVVELTEQSAHATMTLIENSSPLLSKMQVKSVILQQKLHGYKDSQQVNTSTIINKDIDDFLKLVAVTSETVKKDLNEIMLAQNYQDITGQVIQRVSTLVQEVEDNLLALLQTDHEITGTTKSSGAHLEASTQVESTTEKYKEEKGYGPAIPGTNHSADNSDIVNSQEEVDDLLSSLGF